MKAFVRVELHEKESGEKPDYDLLHTEMDKEKFDRFISEASIQKLLPTGCYFSRDRRRLSEVKEAARRAAGRTGFMSEGVATQGDEMEHWGLKEKRVQAPRPVAGRIPPPPTHPSQAVPKPPSTRLTSTPGLLGPKAKLLLTRDRKLQSGMLDAGFE